MEERLAIIADDFTGAADAGVQFGARGRSCALVASLASLVSAEGWAEVVAFDAESRSLDPQAAAAAVRAAVAALRAMGFDRFYKKIDSTLRGNLGAEIDALMEEAGCDLALVAPSAPRNLRTVVAGLCYVSGRPIAETEFAAPPGRGEASSVAAVIARQSRRSISSIGLAVVRQGVEPLAERIAALRARGPAIVVVDAETVDDLATLAGAARVAAAGSARGVPRAQGSGRSLLCVGSSGLAEALAAVEMAPPSLSRSTVSGDHPAPVAPVLGPILFLIGSRSAVAQSQADELLRAGGVFEALVDPRSAAASPAREVERIARALAGRGAATHALVRVAAGGVEEPPPGALGSPGRRAGERLVASLLGELARATLSAERFGLVVATGGDTAAAAAAAMELAALRLHGELLPGVVLSTAPSSRLGRTVTLVTKAGAFGEPDALGRIAALWAGAGR